MEGKHTCYVQNEAGILTREQHVEREDSLSHDIGDGTTKMWLGESGEKIEHGVEESHDGKLVLREAAHLRGDILRSQHFVPYDGP